MYIERLMERLKLIMMACADGCVTYLVTPHNCWMLADRPTVKSDTHLAEGEHPVFAS